MRLTQLVSIATGVLFAHAVAAQTEIKFGHVGEPGSLFAKSAEEFAKRIPHRSFERQVALEADPARGPRHELQRAPLRSRWRTCPTRWATCSCWP